MKHISIIIPDGQADMSTISCISGSSEFLNKANNFQQPGARRKQFKIEIVGATGKAIRVQNFRLQPDISVDLVEKTNLIILPSSQVRGYETATPGNKKIIRWIEQQYRKGAEIASMCSGAFMLAATGLLDGKNCSTHWAVSNHFRLAFPGVNLTADKLITDERGIYTNGGAFSFLNLIMYLVEKYYDRQTAIHCSKIFQVDMGRNQQSEFTIFQGHKKHEDDVVLKAQDYLEKHFSDKISFENLSAKYNTGRRNFDRRFIKATGITPLDYLQRVKIEAAKKSFENTMKTVSEVMYEVGYNDTKAFRDVFSRVTGISPTAYRTKYNSAMYHEIS